MRPRHGERLAVALPQETLGVPNVERQKWVGYRRLHRMAVRSRFLTPPKVSTRLSHCAPNGKRTVLSLERRRQRVIAEMLAQLQFVQLANGGMRQFVDEDNVIWHPPLRDLTFVEREQFVARDLHLLAFDDDEQRPLQPLRMGAGDAGRLCDGRKKFPVNQSLRVILQRLRCVVFDFCQ